MIRSLSGQHAEESSRHGEGKRRVASDANALPSIENTVMITIRQILFQAPAKNFGDVNSFEVNYGALRGGGFGSFAPREMVLPITTSGILLCTLWILATSSRPWIDRSYYRLPSFRLPILPIASSFFALTPSLRALLVDKSCSNALCMRDLVFAIGLCFSCVGPFIAVPIFPGLAAFFAERIAALRPALSPNSLSTSMAILRRFALRDNPAYLSLLG